MSLALNRKAHFKYEILEKFDGGLVLSGHEVKAAKAGRAQLDGAWVKLAGGEAFLVGAQIGPYQAANVPDGFDPARYGVPAEMIASVDRLTLMNLVTTVEGFASAGMTPEELLRHVALTKLN